jgi:hypothetical protein
MAKSTEGAVHQGKPIVALADLLGEPLAQAKQPASKIAHLGYTETVFGERFITLPNSRSGWQNRTQQTDDCFPFLGAPVNVSSLLLSMTV